VAEWKKRTAVKDLPIGPKVAHSTVLSIEDEAVIVAFRKHTLLPLDDCLYALHATIPHLTRSSLHRCLQRHGISRLDTSKNPAILREYCFREALKARKIEDCILSKSNRKIHIPHDAVLYRQRHKIEIMFGRLKDWRRIHTRYDRYAHTFMSAICIPPSGLVTVLCRSLISLCHLCFERQRANSARI
jgi:transposase